MIRQYYAQRRRGGDNPLGVGIIPAGAIFYLQPDWWWRDRYRGKPICRNPVIVEAFLNGTVAAARRNPDTGRWEDVFLAGRSDNAIVRSLRSGRRTTVAVSILVHHEDEGLRHDPATYPDLPILHRKLRRTSASEVAPLPGQIAAVSGFEGEWTTPIPIESTTPGSAAAWG